MGDPSLNLEAAIAIRKFIVMDLGRLLATLLAGMGRALLPADALPDVGCGHRSQGCG